LKLIYIRLKSIFDVENDFKLIVKIPLTGKEEEKRDVKIEQFTFANGAYLLSY